MTIFSKFNSKRKNLQQLMQQQFLQILKSSQFQIIYSLKNRLLFKNLRSNRKALSIHMNSTLNLDLKTSTIQKTVKIKYLKVNKWDSNNSLWVKNLQSLTFTIDSFLLTTITHLDIRKIKYLEISFVHRTTQTSHHIINLRIIHFKQDSIHIKH